MIGNLKNVTLSTPLVLLVLSVTSACTAPAATDAGAPAATADTATVDTPTGGPEPGVNKNVKVTNFEVWEDHMPGIGPRGPLLHATVYLELSDARGFDTDALAAQIEILTEDGSVVASSPLDLIAGPDEPEPQPENRKSVSFAMQPTSSSRKLTVGELLHGAIGFVLDKQPVTVELPAAHLMFTH